jgi:hypothetical protein
VELIATSLAISVTFFFATECITASSELQYLLLSNQLHDMTHFLGSDRVLNMRSQS